MNRVLDDSVDDNHEEVEDDDTDYEFLLLAPG